MYRVLIVDDESIMRMMLSTMVDWEELGFELVGCMSNGREALEYMEHERVGYSGNGYPDARGGRIGTDPACK